MWSYFGLFAYSFDMFWQVAVTSLTTTSWESTGIGIHWGTPGTPHLAHAHALRLIVFHTGWTCFCTCCTNIGALDKYYWYHVQLASPLPSLPKTSLVLMSMETALMATRQKMNSLKIQRIVEEILKDIAGKATGFGGMVVFVAWKMWWFVKQTHQPRPWPDSIKCQVKHLLSFHMNCGQTLLPLHLGVIHNDGDLSQRQIFVAGGHEHKMHHVRF